MHCNNLNEQMQKSGINPIDNVPTCEAQYALQIKLKHAATQAIISNGKSRMKAEKLA